MGQWFAKQDVQWNDNERDLWHAAATGDTQTIERLIQSGVDINCGIKGELSTVAPLLYSFCERHKQTVGLLLNDIYMKNRMDTVEEIVPLTVASINGHTDVVHCLLSKGFKGLDNALCCAVHVKGWKDHLGYLDIVQKLLNFGASPNSGFIMDLLVKNRETGNLNRAPHKKSVLIMAVDNGYLQMTKLLLRRGAEINYSIPVDPYDCAHYNISWDDTFKNERRRRVQILNLLLLYGSDLEEPVLRDPHSTFNACDYATHYIHSNWSLYNSWVIEDWESYLEHFSLAYIVGATNYIRNLDVLDLLFNIQPPSIQQQISIISTNLALSNNWN